MHFLEPKVSFEERTIVKPAITQAPGKAEALDYMKKVDKKPFRPNTLNFRAP